MKKTTIYRRQIDENLFEEELTIEALSAMGNPLELLSALVVRDVPSRIGGHPGKERLQIDGRPSAV